MKSIILLSGGLDSLVSLGLGIKKYNIKLAITFDYGQKSSPQEIQAAKNICKYYKIKHKVIKLNWLKKITHTSLVSDENVPTGKLLDNPEESAKLVWVPNRNGLFLNIAASFADAENYDYILIGANQEEGQTFSDNTQEFIDSLNVEFKFSTRKNPQVVAPLINCQKNDIVKLALENNIPLEYVRSCYQNSEKNCGLCESCMRLKKALIANNNEYYLSKLF